MSISIPFENAQTVRQTIRAKHGAGFELATGDVLEVVDPHGQQVADLFCYSIEDPTDTLSSGRSIDYGESILFTTGSILYGHSGFPMLKIISDSCGRHDFLVTPCSLQMFHMMSGEKNYHPSCLENLQFAFAPFPVFRDKVSTTFNIFMNVTFGADGRVRVETPRSKCGDSIRFVAMMDLYVGLTACSDEGSNGGSCKPIQYEIFPKAGSF